MVVEPQNATIHMNVGGRRTPGGFITVGQRRKVTVSEWKDGIPGISTGARLAVVPSGIKNKPSSTDSQHGLRSLGPRILTPSLSIVVASGPRRATYSEGARSEYLGSTRLCSNSYR